jgi:hypothetical protein
MEGAVDVADAESKGAFQLEIAVDDEGLLNPQTPEPSGMLDMGEEEEQEDDTKEISDAKEGIKESLPVAEGVSTDRSKIIIEEVKVTESTPPTVAPALISAPAASGPAITPVTAVLALTPPIFSFKSAIGAVAASASSSTPTVLVKSPSIDAPTKVSILRPGASVFIPNTTPAPTVSAEDSKKQKNALLMAKLEAEKKRHEGGAAPAKPKILRTPTPSQTAERSAQQARRGNPRGRGRGKPSQ